MPVSQEQVAINPYTSTVPLVQVPPEQIDASTRPANPLQGNYERRGTGALAIGDSIVKGILMGHQIKAQRKDAEARTTIAAADAAAETAYQKYQDALLAAKGNQQDPAAQAAYQAYVGVFEQGKQAKAQFVMPEKPAKGAGAQQKKGLKDEMKSGFSNIKDFFAANPHIVPQIALMTMQPKPQGLSTQGQVQNLELENQKLAGEELQGRVSEQERKQKNEQIYQGGYAQFAGLSREEAAALPPEVKAKYDEWLGSKAALTPMRESLTRYLYKLPNGDLARMTAEEAAEADAKPYVASQTGKLGSREDFISRFANDNKINPDKLKAGQVGYLDQLYKWYNELPSEYSSTTFHVDAQGNLVPLSATNYRGPLPPKMPPGLFAPGMTFFGGAGTEKQPTSTGGMTKPPTAPTTPRAQGGMARPPQVSVGPPAMGTFQKTQLTQKVQTEQADRYAKAEKGYNDALTKARQMLVKGNIDQAGYQKLVTEAQGNLQKAKDEVQKWYDQQVRAIGGTPGDQGQGTMKPPPQAPGPQAAMKPYYVSGYNQPILLTDEEAKKVREKGHTVEDMSALTTQ